MGVVVLLPWHGNILKLYNSLVSRVEESEEFYKIS